jgi:hypothetical protein
MGTGFFFLLIANDPPHSTTPLSAIIKIDLGPFTATPPACAEEFRFSGRRPTNDIAADGARRWSERAWYPYPDSRLISKWKCPTL